MRSLIIIAVISAIALGAITDKIADKIDLSFILGKNLTKANSDFTYRYSQHKVLSVASFATAYGWVSASVDSKTTSPSAKASANAMAGAGALPGALNCPFSLLAYGTGSAAVDVKVSSFLGLIITAVKPQLDSSLQIGAVANAVLSMQEYTPDGNPVGEKISLNAPLTRPCVAQELNSDEVSGVTCTYTPSKTSAKVTVTYVSAEKAGVLSYGKTPVSPRSYEMILEVQDFPLSSPSNHVRMTIALFSASGSAVLDGKSVVVPGNSENLYTAVSEYAVIDNERAEVKVTIKAGSADLQASVDAIIKGSVGTDYEAHIAEVDFPAGAKSFIYDPVVGAGSNVYNAPVINIPETDSAYSSVLSLLVAFVCVVLYLF